jgi:hypothetical protein
VFFCRRDPEATTAILCDGIGSGVKAHLAAEMTVSRLSESVGGGVSAHKAFTSVVARMERARLEREVYPWAALTLVRVGPDGTTTILGYEAPPAVLVSGGSVSVLSGRRLDIAPEATEAACVLLPGDRLMLVSDGITQAGLGQGLADGWGIQGVGRFVAGPELRGESAEDLARAVCDQAREYWQAPAGDDCSVAVLSARRGSVVNILTGPPSRKSKDAAVARAFLAADGIKVVCGATTAAIVGRQTGQEPTVDMGHSSLLAPPKYTLSGVDLVTEGAVTLNQAYNIIDSDPAGWTDTSGVTDLCSLLLGADRVNLTVGGAANPGNETIHFRQQGLIRRGEIASLLAGKLRRMGKLVVQRFV